MIELGSADNALMVLTSFIAANQGKRSKPDHSQHVYDYEANKCRLAYCKAQEKRNSVLKRRKMKRATKLR